MSICDPSLPGPLHSVKPSVVSSTVFISLVGSKGKAADMMKDCVRRKRTRQEMEEVKEFEQSLKEDRQKFFFEAKRLK